MKNLLRILLVGLGLGLMVALFVTALGRQVRATVADAARSLLEATGLNGSSGGSSPDEDLQTRIAETRRRLKEQLAEDTTQES